ncbi:MAG: RNA polymerase sigma factor [Deltaproteobacteria bacterium]|nr:RNA polymerase sigma factor [Deltaproteobacteria bacterium]
MLVLVDGPSDLALVQRVLALDDRHAFTTLVRRHQAPLRAFALRLCAGDVGRADDTAQEAFLLAYRHLASWRREGTLRSWLLKLCYRAFLTEQRRAHRRHEALEEGGDARGAAERTGVEPPDAAARRDVLRAMAELKPEERAALALCCQEGLTHDEAAAVLELPLGTLKSHVARGKERLRALLSGYATEAA